MSLLLLGFFFHAKLFNIRFPAELNYYKLDSWVHFWHIKVGQPVALCLNQSELALYPHCVISCPTYQSGVWKPNIKTMCCCPDSESSVQLFVSLPRPVPWSSLSAVAWCYFHLQFRVLIGLDAGLPPVWRAAASPPRHFFRCGESETPWEQNAVCGLRCLFPRQEYSTLTELLYFLKE